MFCNVGDIVVPTGRVAFVNKLSISDTALELPVCSACAGAIAPLSRTVFTGVAGVLGFDEEVSVKEYPPDGAVK